LSGDDIEAQLAAIGELHVTFAYPTPMAAKAAWERTAGRCRNVAVSRHTIDSDMTRQAVTVLGENRPECLPEIDKARRLLTPAEEIDTPPEVLEALRARRRESLMKALETGHSRRVIRAGEQGAVVGADGRLRLRKREG
jgi:hypothetical protein